jgi:hypothetical protein
VLAALRRTPDEVAEVLDGRIDLATRPAPDEWSIAELISNLVETDGVFRSRVTTVLCTDGVPARRIGATVACKCSGAPPARSRGWDAP